MTVISIMLPVGLMVSIKPDTGHYCGPHVPARIRTSSACRVLILPILVRSPHWAPVGRAASRPTNRFERFIHRAGPAGQGLRADRSPPTLLTTARLVGLGRRPVSIT